MLVQRICRGTQTFPADGQYVSSSQFRRAAESASSNLTEGNEALDFISGLMRSISALVKSLEK